MSTELAMKRLEEIKKEEVSLFDNYLKILDKEMEANKQRPLISLDDYESVLESLDSEIKKIISRIVVYNNERDMLMEIINKNDKR